MLCFLLWFRRRWDLWLLLSGAFFGLSLFSYAITKVFLPLLIALLIVLYWRELKAVRLRVLAAAAAIVMLLALPQAFLLLQHPAEMQAEFQHLSLFHIIATCPGCDPEKAMAAGHSLFYQLIGFAANWLSYFTPSFLFLIGDRGDHWTMVHPPGFGQLLPEQAPLILLALGASISAHRRRIVLLLAGWLIVAALPGCPHDAAGGFPSGSAGVADTARDVRLFGQAVATDAFLAAFASRFAARRAGDRAMDSFLRPRICGAARMAFADGGFEGGGGGADPCGRDIPWRAILPDTTFAIFRPWPHLTSSMGSSRLWARSTSWMTAVSPSCSRQESTEGYIYVLFFERYPPAMFQQGPVLRNNGLFGHVFAFGRYTFVKPNWVYDSLNHGIFVYGGHDRLPKSPAFSIRYPDGSVAYNIVQKWREGRAGRLFRALRSVRSREWRSTSGSSKAHHNHVGVTPAVGLVLVAEHAVASEATLLTRRSRAG